MNSLSHKSPNELFRILMSLRNASKKIALDEKTIVRRLRQLRHCEDLPVNCIEFPGKE